MAETLTTRWCGEHDHPWPEGPSCEYVIETYADDEDQPTHPCEEEWGLPPLPRLDNRTIPTPTRVL